ncbi:MBL fold metallo-hydrolase [Microvirga lotononidis]|uniref:Zn-dependent hydrolase, glyoxylase n=1 Tax=Microvirga lotononidis TaxID=864069 RepID=I4YNR8_9HYPH|nr:MBL fold metallo-hydrolase [Microvirga lotononidis]EIM25610.1 Zn-dependent hydrolase, glyoxylase [Microvirga lotononidis]WQO26088.1 MBL fold metallo-hydrolase [Microvirga lotononidis]
MSVISDIHKVTTGTWRQNGYIVESISRHALVIDPGAEAERFLDIISTRRLVPLAILNTHAHYDHIGAVCGLMEHFAGLPFYLHGADRSLLRQANLYRSLFGEGQSVPLPSNFTDLADIIETGLALREFQVECIATPGHTKGSVCFRLGDHLFTGDTLLPNGAGRTDLPGGSVAQIQGSIKLLASLPSHLTMYPGHGAVGPLREAQACVISTTALTN